MGMRTSATVRRISMALVAFSALSCRNFFQSDDEACAQTSEFGNAGCFEVSGTVVDQHGKPLVGMVVGPRYLPPGAMEGSLLSWRKDVTDLRGNFRVRVTRPTPAEAMQVGAAAPDTMSVYVTAADPRSATDIDGAPTVRETIRTVVVVSPIGVDPVPTVLHFTLKMP